MHWVQSFSNQSTSNMLWTNSKWHAFNQASVVYQHPRIKNSFKAISKIKPLSKCSLNWNKGQVTVRIGIIVQFPFPHTIVRAGSFQIINYLLKGTLKLVNTVVIQLFQSFINVTFILIGSLFQQNQLKVNWVGVWTASHPLPPYVLRNEPSTNKASLFSICNLNLGSAFITINWNQPPGSSALYWGNSESLRHRDGDCTQRWHAKHLLPPLYSLPWENQTLNKNCGYGPVS